MSGNPVSEIDQNLRAEKAHLSEPETIAIIELLKSEIDRLRRDFFCIDKDTGRQYSIIDGGPVPDFDALKSVYQQLEAIGTQQFSAIHTAVLRMKVAVRVLLKAPTITWAEERQLTWSYGGIYQPNIERYRPKPQ